MILFSIIIIFILLFVERRRKMAKVLEVARKLKSKYVALPIVGHGLMFLGSNEDRMTTFQKFSREAFKNKYGSVGVWLGSEFYVVICDAIDAETVSKVFLEKTEVYDFTHDFLGNGSVFAPVSIWRPRRKVLAPSFSQKNLESFMSVFNEQSRVMIDCLTPMAGAGTFCMSKYITSLFMDSVSITTLGVSMNAQQHSHHPILVAFDEYCKDLAERMSTIWLHPDFIYRCLPRYAKSQRNKKLIHDAVDEIIKEKQLEIEQRVHKNNASFNSDEKHARGVTFLEHLMQSFNGKEGYTHREIREEVLVLFFAGSDTTAVGVSFTISMLSRHLEIQKKVYEEIREIFGDSKRFVTVDDLSRLKYLEAVIKESLRLYPPGSVITRKVTREVKLSSGITMPAGTNAALTIWGINRNPRYWGEDADEFNPDRFFKGPLEYPSSFMSFSFGPRNCLGYKSAMMSMKVALVTLLREYRVLPPSEIPPDELKKPLRVEFDIMMKPVEGCKVRLERRESKE